MRAVIQRVLRASVLTDGLLTGSIKSGILILLGIEDADDHSDIEWLAGKMINLRIFNDYTGVMNKSILETGGEILLISQFTLFASTKKGNRPSYIRASKSDIAIPLYNKMIQQLEYGLGKKIQTGTFGADMQIELINDGPVTILIDTKERA